MVPDPHGVGFNCLRGHAFVESGRGCGGADLDYGVVRSDIGCSGNHFWLPLAQLADICCTKSGERPFLAFALARQPTRSHGWAALYLSFKDFLASRLFPRRNRVAAVC